MKFIALKTKNGKERGKITFYCRALDVSVLGLSMDDNMRAGLCVQTADNAELAFPEHSGAILHSDLGSQYTSELFRQELKVVNLKQSMNSAGGRCHDNARCESMWARMKRELFYSRGLKSEDYTIEKLKFMIWRYFMSYWNNRRICSGNNGLPPAEKRRRYYAALLQIA